MMNSENKENEKSDFQDNSVRLFFKYIHTKLKSINHYMLFIAIII